MRFAYIDSHGNEVPIPSVDALALRIQLGAVGPDTQLYDAQADHWGPAETHEIFHTLSRDAGDEGFVAPPPPVVPPSAPTPAARTPPPPGVREPEDDDEDEKDEQAEDASFDLGLTLADPPPEASREHAVAEDGFGDIPLDPLDLASAAEAGGPEAGGPAPTPPTVGGGFDFGDLGSSLELEDAPMDVSQAPSSSAYGGDLELETPMQFTGGIDAGERDVQLEQPMSEFRPDAPPGWMEESGREDVMDFSSVSAEEEAEEALLPAVEAPSRQRRHPKDRPSPPKFKRQRSLSAPIVLVVILLALGVGGYVGWPIVSARLAPQDAPARPAVVMPAMPEQLMPRMRALAESAIADAIRDVDESTAAGDAPNEPAQEWLAGVYLGNASQFADIEAFWSSMGRFVDGLRAGEWELYHEKYVAQVRAQGIAADTAALLIERADSGFVAATEARLGAYDTMDRLIEASLDLHDFLVRNEGDIEYRPATTSTVDPVLEAVPSTPALGEQMWDMVDDITGSLDALGSLDRVSRERLTAALQARLQEVGIQ